MGMDHSCEKDEVCTDPDLLDATMYWTAGSCDSTQASLGQDDIEGITTLYGPHGAIVCSNELAPGEDDTVAFGVIPFTLRCAVSSAVTSQITSVDWNWGDGSTDVSTETAMAHDYTTAGNFTLTATIH